MILAAIIVARNPAQYGFEIEPQPAITYERVAVPAASDLRRLAEWVGTPVDELQALNPELRRWTTPVRGKNYEIKVPVGTAAVIQAKLETAPPTELSAVRWHTVKRGDTLVSLARKFKVSRTELAEANQLTLRSRLRPGQELVIPRVPAPLVSARNLRAAASPGPQTQVAANASGSSASARPTYTVRRGDTLYSIAKRFGLTVNALKALNRLLTNHIMPGDRLTIATGEPVAAQ
jgi:membrane-bound lytic murein transglycosylase D